MKGEIGAGIRIIGTWRDGYYAWCTWQGFRASFATLGPTVAAIISTGLSFPLLVVLALPIVLAIFGLRYGRAAFDRVTLPYWIAGSAFWLSEIHRKDLPHVIFGSALLVILAFHFYRQTRGKWADWILRLIAICAVALALLNPLVATVVQHIIYTPRGIIRDAIGDDPVLQFLSEHVKPGQPIFVYPYAPVYYFLSAARNPTRYSFML